jgi:serine/threonine protein kinase
MAPELLEEPASPSSDIYALGIVLYQMLTGRVPFQGKTTLAVLQRHAQEPPVRPSLINPTISPAIEQVVLCAIEKDPRRRFRTPEELAKAYKQARLSSTTNQQESIVSAPLILKSPPGTIAPSASQATVQAPLQTGLSAPPYPPQPAGTRISSSPQAPVRGPLQTSSWIPPYTPQPKRPLLTAKRLLGIGIGAIILLVLILLLPSLLSSYASKQGYTGTQTPTPIPSPTPTLAANACANQPQAIVNDTANVLDTTQVCNAVKPWPYMLTIYTTEISSQGSNLSNEANSLLTNANTVVMVIGVNNTHHSSQAQMLIKHGDLVQISNIQYSLATQAFVRQAKTGRYTTGTIAAIEVLQTSNPSQQQEENNK